MTEYAQFLKDLFAQRNAGRRTRLAEEMAVMGELPARRMESCPTGLGWPGKMCVSHKGIY
jgi:hypothetical protein